MTKTFRGVAALTAAGTLVLGFGAGGAGAAFAGPVADCAQAAYPSSAKAYAARFTAAWSQGNRALAACYAVGPATQFAFAEFARGGSWSHVREAPGDGFTSEYYRNAAGGQLSLLIRSPSAGRQRAITSVELIGGRTGRVTGYADKLIDAWRAGRRHDALQYATPSVVATLWNFTGGAGGACWKRAYANGDTSDTQVGYTCGARMVDLTIKPGAAAGGQPQAVTAAFPGSEG
ncbi:hypothetical protein [Nostocoides vanveenii]|uniref:Uncharacterized protein n=1 Tax=Nostocoides vanveenii TaxID=330835 RepID=A0ABP4WS35_9MICO